MRRSGRSPGPCWPRSRASWRSTSGSTRRPPGSSRCSGRDGRRCRAASTPRRQRDTRTAEEYFRAGSALDDGDEAKLEQAAAAYRQALELDPYLVAALINLANIHYSRDELVEAQALYERAIGLEPDFFEAHFNLGNIYHDLGRFAEAQVCYREALRSTRSMPTRTSIWRSPSRRWAVAGCPAALARVPSSSRRTESGSSWRGSSRSRLLALGFLALAT